MSPTSAFLEWRMLGDVGLDLDDVAEGAEAKTPRVVSETMRLWGRNLSRMQNLGDSNANIV